MDRRGEERRGEGDLSTRRHGLWTRSASCDACPPCLPASPFPHHPSPSFPILTALLCTRSYSPPQLTNTPHPAPRILPRHIHPDHHPTPAHQRNHPGHHRPRIQRHRRRNRLFLLPRRLRPPRRRPRRNPTHPRLLHLLRRLQARPHQQLFPGRVCRPLRRRGRGE